jgi:arginine deiminase
MTSPDPQAAPFGGPGWRPRTTRLREEMGGVWGSFGVASEWGRLEAVLLHRPGPELARVADPGEALMLGRPDPEGAAREHDALAAGYREAGVEVHRVDPPVHPSPNLMFVADLFFMTPEGAILARPAGEARAGEERWVQRRLADLGVPILRAVGGEGTFEGADAMWLDAGTVLLGRGLRTNGEGARQVASTLADLGVRAVPVDLPPGVMHLMGEVRLVDRDLALARRLRLPDPAVAALRERGYEVRFLPDDTEMDDRYAHNTVTLGPREVLMPAGCPHTQGFLEAAGVRCRTVPLHEIPLAAGGIGCLTGILRRR